MSRNSHAASETWIAVALNLCGVQLQVEQRSEEEKLKGVYGFNQLVSDEISLNRTVPELREEECKWWDYPTDMPTASVILVFHNEGWSTLLRTVNSVLNRSGPRFNRIKSWGRCWAPILVLKFWL